MSKVFPTTKSAKQNIEMQIMRISVGAIVFKCGFGSLRILSTELCAYCMQNANTDEFFLFRLVVFLFCFRASSITLFLLASEEGVGAKGKSEQRKIRRRLYSILGRCAGKREHFLPIFTRFNTVGTFVAERFKIEANFAIVIPLFCSCILRVLSN